MSEQSKRVAGVDVGKATLVAALRAGPAREFANSSVGRERKDNARSRFYRGLREWGKPGKGAMVAAMRKLLLHRNSIARRGTPWTPPGVPN